MGSLPVPAQASGSARSAPSLSPPELLADLQQLVEAGFERKHQGTTFLAVRLSDNAPELCEGLKLLEGRTLPARPAISALAFKTKALSEGDLSPLALRAKPSSRPQAIPKALAQAPHYVVRLAKRADLEAAYPERISVGRAANKDVVLRHTSISKSHAWFELDDRLEWYVVDAGSTNYTFVSGTRATPRERVPVPVGSTLQFGSVEALLLDAATLWKAVRVA